MTASIAGLAISRAMVTTPRIGAPFADRIALTDDSTLTVGARAMLVLGSRSLTGAVRSGGTFGGQGVYSWTGGAGAWGTVVSAQPYHDAGGIWLSDVLRDLASDAGEIGTALEVPDRRLDQAGSWTRPSAPATDLLDALSGRQWWIADDGVTHVGPRPSPAISPAGLSVDPYDAELRRAVVQLGDDGIAPLVPGCILTAPGLPGPLAVGNVTIEVDGATMRVTLWGEATGAELLARLVDHLTAWRRYLQLAPFVVETANADGTVQAQPANALASALPDAPALPLVFGVPGVSATLQRGSLGLMAWPAGDPGSPVVALYPPGTLPESVVFDAAGTVQIGGGAAHPLVWAASNLWFEQMQIAVIQIAAYVNGLVPGAVTTPSAAQPIVTTKAMGV